LREYGLKLGLAFQLVDDALDYGGMASALGKSVGDDFREGKMTLPVIRFLKSCSDEDRTFWRRVIVDHDQQDVDLERAVSMLRKSGALESTLELAKQYSSDAADALDVFPQTALRDTLKDLAGFVVARIS